MSHMKNQLHVSGWHLLAPRWKVQSEHWPEPPSEVTDSAIAVVCTNVANGTPSVALIGGCIGLKTTASVTILNDVGNVQSANNWHNGPQLNIPRWLMGASVCNGYVYVLGGRSNDFAYLDTMERIAVSELFYDHLNKKNESSSSSSSSSSWMTLRCRLSEARGGCAAVTVHDRFILVMGGTNRNSNGDDAVLSSVDIIDTMASASEAAAAMNDTNIHINNDEHQTVVTVSAGPNLHIPRYYLGAAVLNDHIWVVGGNSLSEVLNTVECFQFGSSETNYKTSPSMFSSSIWQLREDLSLRRARRWHGVAAVGQCLVVVGGMGHPNPDDEFNTFNSVELLDPQRGIVYEMLNMAHGVTDCTVMKMPHQGLIVIGRDDNDEVHMESLPCVNLSLTQLKKYSVELGSVKQVSHKQQETAAEKLLLRSRLESKYHSFIFYFLFHKGGHVPCVRKQQETETT